MAKVTMAKTIQERQYEPITVTIELEGPDDKIADLLDQCELELEYRFEKRGLGRKFERSKL
jgi:hypothetical protein